MKNIKNFIFFVTHCPIRTRKRVASFLMILLRRTMDKTSSSSIMKNMQVFPELLGPKNLKRNSRIMKKIYSNIFNSYGKY